MGSRIERPRRFSAARRFFGEILLGSSYNRSWATIDPAGRIGNGRYSAGTL